MKLYNITLNNLRRRKAKMFFVLLGLIIGIATIVSVYGVVETMKSEMTRQVTDFGVNVVITPDAGGLTFSYGGITLPEIMYDVEQLTTEDVNALENLPSSEMIKTISPKLIGLKEIEHGQNVVIVGANLPQEFTVKPWLRLRDPNQEMTKDTNQGDTQSQDGKDMDFELIDLTREELERLNIADNQLVLGPVLAHTLGVKEGDQLTLAGQEFEVFGILLESGSSEDNQAFINLSVAQMLMDRPNEVTVIEMAVDYKAGSEETLLSEIDSKLPHTYVTSLRQETLRRDEMLARIVNFGMSVSVVVLLVGMLVVGLTMTNSVRERTREIGIFRAIGFRKSHIAKLILLEGAIISFAAGIIGYLAGTLIARVLAPYLAATDLQVPWSLEILAVAITLSLTIGLLSTIYPAYKATQQDPAEALRFI
ncbi:ABC transporter permease [Alkalicella caledoniensis]|uniref:ABC transporter permease n=1 Tax=Alkalicella caledoniensis TaxID=2731377 RepID=A0A7G9W425_ALKCA|nr:FtsX-like permease family protein [Alkalicella caledoniensis]QNO13437.1 ABC transporter permease [Alkalicella caledoniensis]